MSEKTYERKCTKVINQINDLIIELNKLQDKEEHGLVLASKTKKLRKKQRRLRSLAEK